MLSNKRDLLTILILCSVFFSLAVWNLGMTKTPITAWQAREDRSFYADLGGVENVNRVYFLVKLGSADVTVYTGSPNSWMYNGALEIPRSLTFTYYRWNDYRVNMETQYLRFNFHDASIEIAEMAILDSNNQKLTFDVISTEGTDTNLSKLVDEQDVVECPPTYMSEAHFDELYFVRTAENYLHLQSPYSWSHPPLGKLIIASGILVFGYSPFGWRIVGVIFATLLIPLIYVMGKKLFGTWIGAFASAFLLTFDFMNFSMGRMATVDVYVAFFSLASQLSFLIYIKGVLKDGWKTSITPLFFAVLFFALGFSTKWIVLFGFLGQLAILLGFRLKEVINQKETLSVKIKRIFDYPFFILLIFILLAVCIYFITYIPNMLAGQSLDDIFNLQWSIFRYHSSLISSHPYASRWYTWPFSLKPVLLFRTYLPNNMMSIIVAMGNPAVCWVGFSFVLLSVERAIRKKFSSIFIVVIFFFQWLPYALISRTTFLYHFYSDVPFLCLATAYFLNKYWSNKWTKIATIAYFSIVIILFGLFYPITSGMPTSISWLDNLKWLETWTFY